MQENNGFMTNELFEETKKNSSDCNIDENNPIDPKQKWRFESYLGYNRSWWHYYRQYKEVINETVLNIIQGAPIDTVSLPLMFSIIHSLELGLKANILELETINPNVAKIKLSGTKYHSIELLYDKFIEHLNTVSKNYAISKEIKDEISEYKKQISVLKEKVHELDKGSYSFRYPVDTEGNYNFTWNTRVNLADIINLYYSIQPFLEFTYDVLNNEGIFRR